MKKVTKISFLTIIFIFLVNISFSAEKSFSDAFFEARENKQNVFQWKGNFYTTKRKDETDQQYKNFLNKNINNKEEKKLVVTTNGNLLEEAIRLFNDKKLKDAKFLFERNMVFNPKNANSYLYLAKIYKEQKDQKKEEKNLETTLLIDPLNEEAILMLMEIGIKKTNYSKVKELSERFTKICKNLCNENKKILEDLKNLEPKNES